MVYIVLSAFKSTYTVVDLCKFLFVFAVLCVLFLYQSQRRFRYFILTEILFVCLFVLKKTQQPCADVSSKSRGSVMAIMGFLVGGVSHENENSNIGYC